ncbi:hypothetical protein ADIARSV_2595 [Arcticibacter svalbardensis MN12-7]|uniref:Uncharacterized protein n=1 Tax=Arcticibacter svalbardensis MN12-7 TaxID=1150600 RepID=R9GQY6_9SPHI|nr:hypothetical protein ADIARSV_2595 [Arcticibacter svalbardensis MN12-7]
MERTGAVEINRLFNENLKHYNLPPGGLGNISVYHEPLPFF